MAALRMLLFALLLPCGGAHAVNAEDLLEPEKAFALSARALDAATVEVSFAIAEGYYLYRERFQFAAESGSVKLGKAQFPAGEMHEDRFFGKAEIYRKEVRIRVPVVSGGDSGRLLVTSQGCADAGVCYAPQEQSVAVQLAAAPAAAVGIVDETNFNAVMRSGRLWAVMAAFLGAGVLLAFTPCVLPMIPILSGIIVGEGAGVTRARAFALSAAYVLGMALAYTAIGIGAGLSGSLLSSALQNAWVLGGFAAIFVALAASMFGLYDLSLPQALQQRLHRTHQGLKGGRVASVAAMGALSAAVVSPCVAAPLAGALLYISQTGDSLLGGTALFSMALGMGIPLLVVGTSQGALLPRTGRWMTSVKGFFGVLLLALAIWIVTPVVPTPVQMLLWASLLVGCGVFLRAIDPLPHDATAPSRLGKALGILALIAGAAQAIGALSGGRDPLRPLGAAEAVSGRAPAVRFERVRSLAELETRLKTANAPVMLDFYAEWCVSCKEMERFTFSDSEVQARLSRMLLLQADVTANSADDKALLKRFSLFGPPGIVFYDRLGREIADMRVVGYEPPQKFLKSLDVVAGR